MSLMLAIAGLNPPAPPAPQARPQPQGGGPPWADRSESAWFYIGDDGEPIITDNWQEALRSTRRHEIIGDVLAVSVPKVTLQILEPEVLMAVNDSMHLNGGGEYEVDRGQPITVMVTWKTVVDNVYFSYLPPGEEIPIVDDGVNQPTSFIEKIEEGVYCARFATEGFEPGPCWIHFWGTMMGKTVVAKYGCIRIKDVPPQL